MSNLLIGGIKGVGKTTYGKLLAERLGRRFIDTDEEIERKLDLTCREIYSTRGREYFRKLEEEVVIGLSGIEDAIISLGGGAVLSSENRRILSELGQLVCLFLEKEKIKERWANKPAFCREGEFDQLYFERMEGYRAMSCIWVRAEEPNLIEILARLAHGQQ